MIARAEDAAKINRIVERFNLASVDAASIVTEAGKEKVESGIPSPEISMPKDREKEKLMDALLGKGAKKEEQSLNPSLAKTEKSPLSEPTLKKQRNTEEGVSKGLTKPSVKKQLEEIKENRKESNRTEKGSISKTVQKRPEVKKKKAKQKVR